MENKNFQCLESGEKFFISRYLAKHKNGTIVYTDVAGKQLTNPNNGYPLSPIKKQGKIQAPLVIKSSQHRAERNSKYFKQRAKKHSESPEQQHLKSKRQHEEISSLTKKYK